MVASHHPVPPRNRANAKRMRRTMTDAERKLWYELRGHRLMGLGFRRQSPIKGFIVDFACPERRLIVELDGSQHARASAEISDQARTTALEADGWTVLRFWNDDVLKSIGDVCEHIVRVVEGR
ncbi:endonuclease domain-containing protein [Pseudohoeflea suaedae]|uniref:Endonuclease domain-containing protein n=2 Tax=Pseudohoeflea suaedae TaxID=877384 RepID=A0A4R5PR97_9HYPH|nr:endonuclease domain-containing protein [Pseudohoeflea suaedae]